MIGLIISGHGNFASGLKTSLNLIAGDFYNVEFVDFEEIDSIQTLKEKYYNSIKNLNDCETLLALTDLAGGSPFKTLVEIKTEIDKPMEVISGANLPMILEISMMKDISTDLSSLSQSALEIGKNSIVQYKYIVHEEIECEDGI